ncbi:S-4TM family putative pore-forming effector [Tessaracoccus sp. Y1736]
MATSKPEYAPPTSASILERQVEKDALRLLIAQRRLYSKAKHWQGLRWVGLLALGLAAPVVSVLMPGFAVAAGAAAGLWIFLGRTWITAREVELMTRAAAVQEEFDQYVFSMPTTISRSALPSPEDIARLAGDDAQLRSVAAKEKLIKWYEIEAHVDGAVSVAISQRANAAYTDRLIRTAVTVWSALAGVWVTTLIVWSMWTGISLPTFLLGVLLPVLPGALDVFEYLSSTRRAARDRADLANTIGSRIGEGPNKPIDGQELLVWQTHLYDLRRTTPQVPDWLYMMTRAKNEAAMGSVARRLGRQSGGEP